MIRLICVPSFVEEKNVVGTMSWRQESSPFQIQPFDRQNLCAIGSQNHIEFRTTPRIRGDRANGLTQRNASCAPRYAGAGSRSPTHHARTRGWSLDYVQPLIPRGERSGLLTRIAATESVSLRERMKN
jgi:hypothetical protein